MWALMASWARRLASTGKALVGYGKSVCSERDGTGSSSRVVALTVTFTTVGVLIAFVVLQHTLPTADQLYGLSALVMAGTGAYIGNRMGRRDDGGGSGGNVDPPAGG